jgi:hypothetical protein
LVGCFQSQEHFLTVDLDITRSVDAKPDMIAPDLQHRYHDVMSDHDALIGVASKDQQRGLPSILGTSEPTGMFAPLSGPNVRTQERYCTSEFCWSCEMAHRPDWNDCCSMVSWVLTWATSVLSVPESWACIAALEALAWVENACICW